MFKVIALFLLIGSAVALKEGAKCDLNGAIHRCVKSGILLQAEKDPSKVRLPSTVASLNQVCEELKGSETCASGYIEDCAANEREKRVLGHSLESGTRIFNRLCKTRKRKNDFVKNSPCGNAVVKEGMKCLDDYRRQLYAAASLPKGDKDKIMRIMCCKVRDIGPCVGQVMRSKGEQVCSAENIEYYKKVEKQLKDELLFVICADYEKDSCENVVVPSIDEKKVGKSIIYPMKVILEKVI